MLKFRAVISMPETQAKTRTRPASAPVPARKPGRKKGRTHTARLDFRLPPEARDKIEKAAYFSGQNLSEFAAAVLVREAEAVIERQHKRTMSQRDWQDFVDYLANPPEPNEALKLAAERYKRGRVEGDRYYLPDDWEKLEPGETPDEGY